MTGTFYPANAARLEANRMLIGGATDDDIAELVATLAAECLRVNPSFIGGGSDGWRDYVESAGGQA